MTINENSNSYENLPQALLDELKNNDAHKPHSKIVNILKDAKASLTVNQILIIYYKKHNKILKRLSVLTVLSVLTSTGTISRVSRGTYIYKVTTNG